MILINQELTLGVLGFSRLIKPKIEQATREKIKSITL